MKKKFKDTKLGKSLGLLLTGAVDVLPGGTTIKNIITDVATKKLDRDGDGKISIKDFKPLELTGVFAGLAVLSLLVSKGIINIEILKEIASIFGF